MANIEYLWSDRRRRLGLPLSFTRYALSSDRLFLETGMLSTHCEEILLYRVRDLSLTITLGQRIFGVGTITVQSSDKSLPVLELKNIKTPRDTKEIIHQAV
ncbi:MAG: PH domain-containing protein [Oscillospiraceae bacterium]|nr:PH domain-containing protein [Oscillospiraceae bacterium]